MEDSASVSTARAPRRDMLEEARRLVDTARDRGVVLRLFGGLAVRDHCKVADFCERDYADLDMMGLSRQAREIAALMADMGYREDAHVRRVTGSQRRFYRSCAHRRDGGHVHDLDRVDVFLDTFHMEHELPLKRRLTVAGYTIPVTELLLTKLQVVRHNEKDVRDILTLLKDVDMAEVDAADVVDPRSIAARCARDWGLYHDVMASLELCRTLAGRYGLSDDERTRVRDRAGRLQAALRAAPKPIAWRVRARVGTRMRWYDEVEEQGA
jgi:hypothetical protein